MATNPDFNCREQANALIERIVGGCWQSVHWSDGGSAFRTRFGNAERLNARQTTGSCVRILALASNAVIQVHNAIWERTGGNQFELDIPMARSDERNPVADHREFIDPCRITGSAARDQAA